MVGEAGGSHLFLVNENMHSPYEIFTTWKYILTETDKQLRRYVRVFTNNRHFESPTSGMRLNHKFLMTR